MDWLMKGWAFVKSMLLWIDSIGFAFVDNAYSLMISVSAGFDETVVKGIVENIMRNAYVLVGIFALFRIALILINSMISPDKLTEEKKGIGNVLVRLVITIVLFIAVPILFQASRELQNLVIENNYISKFIAGTELYKPPKEESNNQDELNDNDSPGVLVQLTTIKSLIKPDSRLFGDVSNDSMKKDCSGNGTITGYSPSNEMKQVCQNWNENKVRFSTLSNDIAVFDKVNGEYIFAYDYIPFVTLGIGLFVTYVFLSFAIDIAVRSIELLALEVLSPLFVVTYIDPSSSTNGPFKKWLTATGKSYASLFIKIAIISLMLLFLSNLSGLMRNIPGDNAFIKLIMILAILIFAKKAPKWIGDMIGISDGAGLGGLGIGKKLAGAALVGGAVKKATDAAGKFAAQKGKNFLGNRARNTAARLGGMHEQRVANKNAKEKGLEKERSIWQGGRAAVKNTKANYSGKNSEGLKDFSTGLMAGRSLINRDAKTFSEKREEKARQKAEEYGAKVGLDQASIRAKLKETEENKTARALHRGIHLDANGKRDKNLSYQNGVEFNNSLRSSYVDSNGNPIAKNPQTEIESYLADMQNRNLIRSVNYNSSGQITSIVDSNGTTISDQNRIKSLVTDFKSKQSLALQDFHKLETSKNSQKTENEYFNAVKEVIELNTKLSTQRNSLSEAIANNSKVLGDMSTINIGGFSYTDPTTGRINLIPGGDAANLMARYESSTNPAEKQAIKAKLESVCSDKFWTAQASSDNIKALKNSISDAEKQQKAWATEASTKASILAATSEQFVGGDGFNPKDNPLAVEVNGKFVTPVGEYVDLGGGNWRFDRKNVSTVSQDTFVSGTSDKVSKAQKNADKSMEDAKNNKEKK